MSLGALKDLWQIEGEEPHIPSEQELSAVLKKTGSGALTIVDDKVIKSKADLKIDLGGELPRGGMLLIVLLAYYDKPESHQQRLTLAEISPSSVTSRVAPLEDWDSTSTPDK